jgi:hypothetical protein
VDPFIRTYTSMRAIATLGDLEFELVALLNSFCVPSLHSFLDATFPPARESASSHMPCPSAAHFDGGGGALPVPPARGVHATREPGGGRHPAAGLEAGGAGRRAGVRDPGGNPDEIPLHGFDDDDDDDEAAHGQHGGPCRKHGADVRGGGGVGVDAGGAGCRVRADSAGDEGGRRDAQGYRVSRRFEEFGVGPIIRHATVGHFFGVGPCVPSPPVDPELTGRVLELLLKFAQDSRAASATNWLIPTKFAVDHSELVNFLARKLEVPHLGCLGIVVSQRLLHAGVGGLSHEMLLVQHVAGKREALLRATQERWHKFSKVIIQCLYRVNTLGH